MVLVAGARPNFMKVAPVLWAAENRGIDVTLVHSGQHYDRNMSDVFFDDLGIRAPDVNLGVGSGTQAEQTAAVMVEFEKIVAPGGVDLLTVVSAWGACADGCPTPCCEGDLDGDCDVDVYDLIAVFEHWD